MGLTLRYATDADADLLYQWRRDDEHNDWWEGSPVTWDAHIGWLRPRIDNPLVHIWVGELDGIPIGQARLDSNGELAFSIDKAFRGRGHGTELVRLATAEGRKHHGRVKASVDLSNKASVKTMIRAGYVLRSDVGFMLCR